jgi:glycine/D-amino acid oxidase-like deaminating enzyme
MGAVRFDGQAQIHALRYVQGLARAVDGNGSFVFEQSPATGFRDGSPAVVAAERGSVRAKEIIVATNLPFGDHGRFAERCHAHRSYIVAGRSAVPPLDATFVSVDDPMRSILTADVEGTSYVLSGGEGTRPPKALIPANGTAGSRLLPATAWAPGRSSSAGPPRTPCQPTGCPMWA